MHGETSYAKMAVVCTCPASSSAVAPIILQVLRVTLFATLGSDFNSGGRTRKKQLEQHKQHRLENFDYQQRIFILQPHRETRDPPEHPSQMLPTGGGRKEATAAAPPATARPSPTSHPSPTDPALRANPYPEVTDLPSWHCRVTFLSCVDYSIK